jgi:hypothetical protein
METVLHALVKLIVQSVGWIFHSENRRVDLARSSSWPLVTGRVSKTYAAGERWETYYSYQVNGAYFSGSFRSLRFPVELQGKNVLVRYKPDQPEVSLFFDSDQIGQ